MRKTIGIIIIASVFTLLIGATCLAYGWKEGIVAWLIAVALGGAVALGTELIVSAWVDELYGRTRKRRK